jgi:hypothetical protein
MLHEYHTHGMPDMGTDTHSDKVLARIYGALGEVNAFGEIGEGGRHWASDAHRVDGVAHGHGADDGKGTTAKSERVVSARVMPAAESDADRFIRLQAEIDALSAILVASKAIADAELAAIFDAAEADEQRALEAATELTPDA